MTSVRLPLFLALLCLFLNNAQSGWAQSGQDNQPQILPRQGAPTPKPKRQPKPQPQAPANAKQPEKPAEPAPDAQQKGESSSIASHINPDRRTSLPYPAAPAAEG